MPRFKPYSFLLGILLLSLALPLHAEDDRLQQAADLRDSEPAKALEIARDVLEESQARGDEGTAALARLQLAHALEVLGGHDEALVILDDAERQFRQEGATAQLADALKLRGAILFYQGRYDRALEAFQKAYELHEANDDAAGQAEALNRMGRVYDSQGNPDRALDYYRRSLSEQERVGNLDGMATQLNNIATIERQQGRIEEALAAYERSIELREETGNLRDMAGTYSNIGVLYHFEDEREKALDWQSRALALHEQVGDQLGAARTHFNLGRMLTAYGREDEALPHYETSLAIAQETNTLNLLRLLYDQLSELKANDGDYPAALEYSHKARDVRAELFDVERQREIEGMNARFETSRKEREIALLHEQRRFDGLVRNTAVGGSVLMLILIAVTYNRYRIKLRANHTIQKKNEELSTLDSIVAAINSEEEFEDVLSILLNRTVEFFHNADKGAVLILDPSNRRFYIASAYGFPGAEIDTSDMDFDTVIDHYTHGGQAIGEGIYLHDPASPLGNEGLSEDIQPRVSMVVMTIMIDRQIEGFLLLTNSPDNPAFRASDAERLSRIREHAVSALTRARHMEHLKDENLRAEDAICRLRIAERNLKQAVDDARKANTIKSDFLARMSHELRTPLNAIIGYSEMLARELNQGETSGFAIDAQRIRSAGQHLLTLINELLDLSKIEAGKTDINPSDIQINELIEDVGAMIRPQVEENRNDLILECSETGLIIQTDPLRLRQILFNLLANATKFTEGGEIKLHVETGRDHQGADTVFFHVSDNGIGMTEEQVRRVFDSFTQADETISRRFGGTGLGLSVSRGLAQLLGGDISVESKPGKGSIFTLSLPLRLSDVSQKASTEDRPADSRMKPTSSDRILIVEDNDVNRDMLSRHLEIEGYSTLFATDGGEAIETASREQPSLILMDMSLPTMDGWEATKHLKASASTRHIPVIGLSAHAMNSHRHRALEAGCDEYEHKPIDFEKLFSKIRKLSGA